MVCCELTKNCLILKRKIVFKQSRPRSYASVIGQVTYHQPFQLSVIGQLTSSCIISDLGCKEQPIKLQYFNIGNNNTIYRFQQWESRKSGQILVSLFKYSPFHDSHQKDSCFQTYKLNIR